MLYRVKGRRKSRLMALEAIYRDLLLGDNPVETLNDIFEREEADQNQKEHAKKIVETFFARKDFIFEKLRQIVKNWDLERILYLDKAIICMAAAEIMCRFPDVPLEVAVNEAVEIAKIYSTEDSGKFVNGILDSFAKLIGFKK